VLITGNPNYGLAKEIGILYPEAFFASRESSFDLTQRKDQEKLSLEALKHDIIINNSALWKFNQTVLLDTIYKKCVDENHRPHIICIGSTTDRVKKGGSWLYNAEKKALRDYCNTLGISGVWSEKPKVTYISFGTLSNKQEKHPDRKCLNITEAAKYVSWIISQPKHININEISIDPMQSL